MKRKLKQLSQTCHRQYFGPRPDSLLPGAQCTKLLFTTYIHTKKEISSTGSEHLLQIFLCKNDLELKVSFSHKHKSSEGRKASTITNVAGKFPLEENITTNDN